MGSKNCMNEACRTTTSSEWKKGWSLKSGGFATLCHNCGAMYENSVFCETFHFKESGWRECRLCAKIIHCGCNASRYLYEFMDFGGISCLSCAKHLEIQHVQPVQTPGDLPGAPFMTNGIKDVYPLVTEHKRNDDKFSTERLLQLTKAVGAHDVISKLEQLRQQESILKTMDAQKCVSNLRQQCSSSAFLKPDISQPKQEVKDTYESLAQQSLNFSLATPLGSSSSVAANKHEENGSSQDTEGTNSESSALQVAAISQPRTRLEILQSLREPSPSPPAITPLDSINSSLNDLSQKLLQVVRAHSVSDVANDSFRVNTNTELRRMREKISSLSSRLHELTSVVMTAQVQRTESEARIISRVDRLGFRLGSQINQVLQQGNDKKGERGEPSGSGGGQGAPGAAPGV